MSDRDTRNEAPQKPNDTLGDKIANAFDGHDDPKRGPIDRLANAIDGTDDPNKGPLDRAQNAIDGTDFPNKGPLDRALERMVPLQVSPRGQDRAKRTIAQTNDGLASDDKAARNASG